MSATFVHVVAGVLRDAHGRVLLAQRPTGKHLAGLWEFPGGKVEPGEQRYAALQRELHEEIGVVVNAARPLISVRHHYPDKSVWLDVWDVEQFAGEPRGRENQPLQWLAADQLSSVSMPDADVPIVRALRLPEHYAITPEPISDAQFLADVARLLEQGVKLIQLRAKHYPLPQWREMARRAATLAHQAGAQVLINTYADWVNDVGADGVHLTAAQLMQTAARPLPASTWVAASCHNAAELAHAGRIGADFAVLSPVCATRSHPDATPLGWAQFEELLRAVNMPVYALGGVERRDTSRAREYGARGIAGISAFFTG